LLPLQEQGDLPRVFSRVHPRYHTPAHAIVATGALALALALSGSFAKLAVVSAVARLVAYAGTAAATLQLRRLERAGLAAPAAFVVPVGALVPVLALLTSLLILAGATTGQLAAGLVALLAGGLFFLASTAGGDDNGRKRHTTEESKPRRTRRRRGEHGS